MQKPFLNQVNIVTRDFGQCEDFYRRIGVKFEPPLTPLGRKSFHKNGEDIRSNRVEFDSAEFAQIWNPGWAGRGDLNGRLVLGFTCPSRDDVDRIFRDLADAGYRALAQPHDAFWGSRYAIVEDPNGIAVGLMSEIDPDYRSEPPAGFGA